MRATKANLWHRASCRVKLPLPSNPQTLRMGKLIVSPSALQSKLKGSSALTMEWPGAPAHTLRQILLASPLL